MRNRFPIFGRGKEFPRVRTEFPRNEKSQTGTAAPTFMVKQQTLPDGSRVKLTTIGQFATKSGLGAVGTPMQPSLRTAITLSIGSGGTPQECSYESGLFDLINPVTHSADGYFSRIAFRAAAQTWVDSEDFLGSLSGGGAGNATCLSLPLPGSMATSQSSRFSGKMRQVVQVIAGTAEPIPFSFCWGDTHGIYVASDGDWWVVRVSNSAGIMAWPLAYCTSLGNEQRAELESHGMLGIPSSAHRSTGIVLASAADLAAYTATTPFYQECGWAFSYNGHEAQNITWIWSEGEGTELSPRWKKAQRWKIIISESSGIPNNAEVYLEEETYIWWPLDGGVKFPHYIPAALGGGQSLFTFNSAPEPIYADAHPDTATRQPAYVFYTEGSTDPVIIYKDVTDSQEDEEVNTVPPSPKCPGSTVWRHPRFPGESQGAYGSYTKSFDPAPQYTMDGPLTQPEELGGTWSTDDGFNVIEDWEAGGWHSGALYGDGRRYIYSQAWEYRHIIGVGTATYTNRQALLIPFYDREQAYFYYNEHESINIPAASGRSGGMAYGDKYFVNSVATHVDAPECVGDGDSAFWQSKVCDAPIPEPITMTEFDRITGPEWSSAPYYCTLNECRPDGIPTWWFTRLGGGPLTACGTQYQSFGNVTVETQGRQALYAFNAQSGNMEAVKEWDEYDDFDPYTAMHISVESGSQILVSHPDAFTNKTFLSGEMNGYQGDGYYFFGSPDTTYPLADLTAGLDRGWFGVPFF